MMDPATIVAYAQLLTPLGVIIAAILSYMGLRQAKRTHRDINGRMDQMLELKGSASKAEGAQEERDRKG